MTGDESSRLKSLIQQAIMLSDEERRAYLDDACKDNPSLRLRVETVLASIDNPATPHYTGWALPAEGSRIGKYTIIEKLGGGGMGVVFRAEDSRLKRQVALKFLAPELTRDIDARDRFIQEAQAASALDHSNICTIYEIDETPEGLTYIAMACYEGETLKKHLERGPVPVEQAVDFVTQIGKGLARAHAKGIIHRDIKPGNIMVIHDEERAVIKILDFGLAKITDVSLTRTGSTLGTAAYMSPEQARGDSVDHRADIWSLGVVFYELLTGQRPFGGAFEQAMIYALLHESHRPITEYRPDLAPQMNAVIDRVLAKERKDRYQTIQEFLDSLAKSQRGLPQIDAGSMKHGITTKRTRVPDRRPGVLPEKTKGVRVRWPIITGIALIALATWFFASRSAQESPAAPPSGANIRQVTFTGSANYPAMSPDGELIAYYSRDSDSTGSIKVQELSGGQPLTILSNITYWRQENLEDGSAVRWSPDGKTVAAVAGLDGKDVPELHLIPRLGGEVRSIPGLGNAYFDWSPDGSRIAYADKSANFIWFIDIATLSESEISFAQGENEWITDLVWSPAGDRLALLTTNPEKGTFSILQIAPDGSSRDLVLMDSVALSSPRWAADGKSIYYLRRGGNTFDLWKTPVSLRSSAPRLLHPRLLEGFQISLSKTNEKLVYFNNQIHSNIWLFDTENSGTAPLKLASQTSLIWDVQFAPNDSLIAFFRQDASGENIYIMPVKGGAINQVTFLRGGSGAGIAWNSEADKIAFGREENGQRNTWQVDIKTGAIRTFENTELSAHLTWEPGQHITYQLPGNRNFGLINPETGAVRVLVENDSVGWMFSPRYSPDGSRLAVYWNRRGPGTDRSYGAGRGIWAISLSDNVQQPVGPRFGLFEPIRWSADSKWIYARYKLNDPMEIVRLASDGTSSDVMFSIPRTDRIDITRDGRYIVAVLDEVKSDIWVMENFDPEVEGSITR